MPHSSFELIKFHSVSKSFGPKKVLTNVSLSISRGDRIALIGENGSGKSTIARLIMRHEPPDEGDVWVSPSAKIGFLPQDSIVRKCTVHDFLLEAHGGLFALSERLAELEKLLALLPPGSEMEKGLVEWDLHYQNFLDEGGYEAFEKIETCLQDLQNDYLSLDLLFNQLSEGERRSVQLAAALLKKPDILLLDEPTNHLDSKALAWLEQTLNQFDGAVILISHDRFFINQLATQIFELSACQLRKYCVNYDAYLDAKHKETEQLLKEYEQEKEERAFLKNYLAEQTYASRKVPPPKDGNKMAYDKRGERHMNGKRKRIAQAKARLENMDIEKKAHPIPKDYRGIAFIPKKNLHCPITLQLEDVEVERGGKTIIKGFSGTAGIGDRIIMAGPNGCGKSTLLHLLAKNEPPKNGKMIFASEAVVSFLPQDAFFENEQSTLIDHLQRKFSMPEHTIRSHLHRLSLIEEAFIAQKIVSLSLGQKRKLQLIEILLEGANVLLLDEPTNHLALSMIDQLEEALLNFPGTVIAATHDRRFMQRVATSYWEWHGIFE